jgi:TonB family protein
LPRRFALALSLVKFGLGKNVPFYILSKIARKIWVRRSLLMPARVAVGLICLQSLLWAQGAQTPPTPIPPQSFYLAAFEKDSWTIVDVQPASGVDTRVRFIRVYPACGSYRIDESEYLFENASVAELAAGADICANENTVADIIRSSGKKGEDLFGKKYQGIAARCGSHEYVHKLPPVESLRFSRVETRAPRVAALWILSQRISEKFLKETGRELFLHTPWESHPAEERQRAEAAAVEIRSGDFDLATPELPDYRSEGGRSKLSDVMPDSQEAMAPEHNSVVVPHQDIQGLLIHEVTVSYPQMANIAHISGDVEVEVSIDPETGKVISAVAKSGHPILQQAATEAIRQWVIIRYRGPNPLSLTVHFEYHCPPLIEAEKATSANKIKKRSHKPARKKQLRQ